MQNRSCVGDQGVSGKAKPLKRPLAGDMPSEDGADACGARRFDDLDDLGQDLLTVCDLAEDPGLHVADQQCQGARIAGFLKRARDVQPVSLVHARTLGADSLMPHDRRDPALQETSMHVARCQWDLLLWGYGYYPVDRGGRALSALHLSLQIAA